MPLSQGVTPFTSCAGDVMVTYARMMDGSGSPEVRRALSGEWLSWCWNEFLRDCDAGVPSQIAGYEVWSFTTAPYTPNARPNLRAASEATATHAELFERNQVCIELRYSLIVGDTSSPEMFLKVSQCLQNSPNPLAPCRIPVARRLAEGDTVDEALLASDVSATTTAAYCAARAR
ncbi:hypothetical protein B0293_28665 [Amycolatopsis azurea DSM 43854]|uniref:Uncharacterized protein n=1 Tax=Amycolatopsis azurea DSM 43854 TaxID=1238180 RepID=A0ABX3J6W7_9PSEU|nr:hypothetical protein B0293_28665 [Amycolatopsis azurea DSM 43854]